MNKKFLILSATTILSLGVVANFSPAAAQLPTSQAESAVSTADPGRISEQLEAPSLIPQLGPAIDVKDLRPQNAPPGAENVKLPLNRLIVENTNIYSAEELSQIYADKIGQTITLADVYAIAADLTRRYRNDGYILTQAVVPPQTIEDGTVTLRAVEGYVNSVVVEGDVGGMDMINAYAQQIRTKNDGGPLNVKDLERQLLLINDLPGVSARSVLSPSATQTGAADLRIIVERDPFDALIGINNYGSRFLGPLQLNGAASLNNPFFDLNERITAQLVVAPDSLSHHELGYFSLGYEQPVWQYGTKLQLFTSYTDTEPGFNLDQFDVEGKSVFASATLEHPFIRSRSQNLYGRILFDWRDVETKNNVEPTREDRIRAIRAGGRYDFLDTLIGIGINSIDIEVSQGLGILGASNEGSSTLTRPQGDPTFFKVNFEAQRLQRITKDINLLLAGQGQWANDALLSSEEFGVGGINIGRGFDPSEIVGDDGIAGKIELQWNRPIQWDLVQDYQVFGFFDAGRIWNDDATVPSLEEETATSTGLGLRTEFMDNTNADFAIAFPLNRDVETQNDRDPRFYMSLSRSF